ncbi:hypothetical protein ANANG_G00111460 [Anguilla anguilla]|uniref:Uncharacterized protein n=1 Tax=Anguilla anguilla TaxID=7936 RepID=A0A9D3RZZ3_ANGAN|nr:hypothetical protein ANANG_G00111460 [Anguilla anguilla]
MRGKCWNYSQRGVYPHPPVQFRLSQRCCEDQLTGTGTGPAPVSSALPGVCWFSVQRQAELHSVVFLQRKWRADLAQCDGEPADVL